MVVFDGTTQITNTEKHTFRHSESKTQKLDPWVPCMIDVIYDVINLVFFADSNELYLFSLCRKLAELKGFTFLDHHNRRFCRNNPVC